MEIIDNWREEKNSAYLYKVIADHEKNSEHKKLFQNLAKMAEKQADIWASQLKTSEPSLLDFQPNYRTRFIAGLVKLVGARYCRIILAATKVRGMSIYRNNSLRQQFPDVFHQAHEQRSITNGSNIRAAVFGVNDGLVSNASLIFAIAGANMQPSIILLSGIAGLLAGAFSMGSGEYVSVRSQREMLEYQLELEKHELDTYPEEEAQELALIYEARGLPKIEAERVANLLIKNPEKALDTLAREELGINPDDLVSPWGAAIASFISFTIGAFIPLLPYVVSDSRYNLFFSMILFAVTLFLIGSALSLFTHRNALWSGLRTLLIGSGAGAITYLVGYFLGVNIA